MLTASAAAVLAAAPPAFADEAVVEEAAALYTDAMELAVLEAEEAIKAAEQALVSWLSWWWGREGGKGVGWKSG